MGRGGSRASSRSRSSHSYSKPASPPTVISRPTPTPAGPSLMGSMAATAGGVVVGNGLSRMMFGPSERSSVSSMAPAIPPTATSESRFPVSNIDDPALETCLRKAIQEPINDSRFSHTLFARIGNCLNIQTI